jgi:hypothetical protein
MRTSRLGLLAALALSLTAGCSTNPNAPAKVKGKVTYNGKPIGAGTLTFHSPDKGDYTASLLEDGSYDMSDVPAGTLTVTVDTEMYNPNRKVPAYGGGKGAGIDKDYMEAMKKGGGQPNPDQGKNNYVKIPAKYAKADSSGLSVTLKAGKQEQNFDLKD